METKVKICGIRKLESAIASIDAGADFLGFNFVEWSPRYVATKKAKEIMKKVKGKVKIVGVFMSHPIAYVNEIIDFLDLDYVQLHGDETNEFCQQAHAKVIKVVSIKNDCKPKEILDQMNQYSVDYFMLDITKKTEGTMMNFLTHAEEIASKKNIFLSGKLDSENVRQAIHVVQPFAVDVTRGIETDRMEDVEKIREFVKEVKK